jgi:outer membrane protein TolC
MKRFNGLYHSLFLTLAGWLLTVSNTLAQTPDSSWTFARCIERAFEYSPMLKIEQNKLHQSTIDYHQSQWNLLPSVEAGSSWSLYFNRSTNQDNQISGGDNYSGYYGLSANMDLIGGGAKLRAIRMANLMMQKTQQQVQTNKMALYMDVLQAYVDVIYGDGIKKHAIKQLNTGQQELTRIKMMVEVGRAPESSITEMEATVAGYRLALTQASGQHTMALNKLKYLLALPFNDSCKIDAADRMLQLPQKPDIDADSVYRMASKSYPRLKEQQLQVQVMKQQLNIVRTSRLPHLNLTGNYGSYFYSTDKDTNGDVTSFNDQMDKYFNPSAGVSLSIPIFKGKERTTQIRKSKLEMASAKYQLENELLTIQKEINEVWLSLDTQYRAFEAASDYVTHMTKVFDAMREKFALGLVNMTDYDQAQLKLTDAQNKQLSARLNWLVQRELLDMYCGKTALLFK